ncbi:N-6 DNA methylase [Bartonella kosoyi]|uniref:N-6 DNA methylase n=1 Tax=Bartonella kosoyi TaxID=2133959 RepID=A0A5B9CXY4_9HYPH|nr:type ISP restriction/modification enzyme [Bartonella kosoyi]QEE09454.1 N-6 DNA methylase [Bartonella kosoyi]
MLQSLKSDHEHVTLRSLLEYYRQQAKSPRELGTLFENLVKVYLAEDPLQKQEYEKVQTYLEWAKEHDEDGRDIGIDLVATIRDQGGYAAIQCKCYDASHIIKKEDIDSFIAASGKKIFTRRILVDSTESNWSDNANNTCDGQEVRIQQINLFDLENSQIDWGAYKERGQAVLKEQPKKKLLDHQIEALERVCEGLKEADRGKLIMACGTGKTFTSLKIAETIAGKGKRVLFLVPSLALMSQTIREWTLDTEIPLRSFAVCSDTQVGKRRKSKQDDESGLDASDLVLPATTDSQELARKANKTSLDVMTVVFSTYHSIQVISDAQKEYDLPEFDLIICDEAHRTTGVVLGTDKHESEFIKVHDNSIIRGKKRLYMTATPKIFADSAKKQAHEMNGILASMDDEALYGKELYTYTFSKAVKNELLVPYKIIILGVNEEEVCESIQHLMTDENYELILDDKTKIIGCYQALAKIDLKVDLSDDPNPMRRALAFCKDIKTSERIRDTFNSQEIQKELYNLHKLYKETPPLQCTFAHIDGTQSAKKRNEALDWLKEDAGENTCRVLTNVRCLSEGVDVPALDAIMFLHPRKSQVDVIQAVGRIMRRAKGKKRGYIILPVGVPAGISAEEALKYNKRYSVVWQVINALLAHDENFEITLNQMILGQDVSDVLEISALKSMTAVEDKIYVYEKPESAGLEIGKAAYEPQKYIHSVTGRLPFYKEFPNALKTLLAKKFTLADYWGIWAGNVAEIAQNHITHLQNLLADENSEAFHAFDAFHKELKNNLNSEIKQEEALEMLGQHLVTRPVFEALFEGNEFVQNNAISQAMEKILAELDKTNIKQVSKELQEFYDSVKFRASGITSPQARQNLIIKLYEDFFTKAFKKTTDRLGIVYTPVEVVDFIIHSVDDVLRKEFGKSLGSRGVSILDPFTGTGTFITRLLQSDLIKPEDMEYKFRHDIHANEIVLLAYYIAAINIESTYHSLMKGDYIPFKHIGLADTFRMLEEKNLLQELFKENSEYLEHQKKLDIQVIFGNPPYSVGQKSANDNAKNTPYPILDDRIRETYATYSTTSLLQALYDSYIRAIRWASDRINNAGVIGFVTNAGFIDGSSMDGLRKCLVEEFSSLYIFHLRGNQRTSGELSRKEGGKIFGSGSRAPIAISILVKNPNAQPRGKIYFRDIGDYLNRKEKLTIIEKFRSIDGITRSKKGWQIITPDKHGDWIKQREADFNRFIPMGIKNNSIDAALFREVSRGVNSARDAWVYNFSSNALNLSIQKTIEFFNIQKRLIAENPSVPIRKIIDYDATKISWANALISKLKQGSNATFDVHLKVPVLYRPFMITWHYASPLLNEALGKTHQFFNQDIPHNLGICISGEGSQKAFSCLMTNKPISFDTLEKSRCYPFMLYCEEKKHHDHSLFMTNEKKKIRDGITDAGLARFKVAYPNETITKEDIFYYVYGLLHSEDYRARYAHNLCKELPRIPCVKSASDFWKFVTAGRELGHLHVNYEDVEPYPVTFKKGNPKQTEISNPEKFYYVTEMKFAKAGKEKDKTTVIYNSNITITDIPLEAYKYIVNGKPALEWVMGRQCVKTDQKSGIVNDANRYAVETVGNPAYPLELFQRVITVSLETMKIVKNLPKLEIRETE